MKVLKHEPIINGNVLIVISNIIMKLLAVKKNIGLLEVLRMHGIGKGRRKGAREHGTEPVGLTIQTAS